MMRREWNGIKVQIRSTGNGAALSRPPGTRGFELDGNLYLKRFDGDGASLVFCRKDIRETPLFRNAVETKN